VISLSDEEGSPGEQHGDLVEMARRIIRGMFGEPGEKIFNYLLENGYIAEERIANTLDIRSNEARKMLQKLSDEAVVVPNRLKDEETGDLLHTWKLNRAALKSFVLNRLRKTRERLEILLKYEEQGALYICKSCSRRFLVDEAYAYSFQCPYDNDVLVEANNPAIIEKLREAIRRLDKVISMVERM
jgi:transcription initiation factor TFIIE subunit alpha